MAKLKLNKTNGRWEWTGTFEERIYPKEAGFRWDSLNKVWYTYDNYNASQLNRFKVVDEDEVREIPDCMKSSYATESDSVYPAPDGLSYFPYQVAGIDYMLSHDSTLMSDEPGLGKTIQSAGYLNALYEKGFLSAVSRVLIVSPASMMLTWDREMKKWLTFKADIVTFTKPALVKSRFSNAQISIISFERLVTAVKALGEFPAYDVLIVDEAHFCKSESAKRTTVVMEIAKRTARKVFLTGTPLPNRPIELWPLISTLRPDLYDSRDWFAKHHCNRRLVKIPIRVNRGYSGPAYKMAWVEDGAEHLEELNNTLRSNFMIRRRKKDVLQQLPPKTIQTVTLPSSGREVAAEMKEWNKLVEVYGEDEALRRLIGCESGVAMEEMAKIRKNLSLAKSKYVVEFVENLVHQGEKVIVMCHHRATVDGFMESFKEHKPVKVVGGMSADEKQKSVDSFQNGDSMVFIGNMRAAGVGLTLTSSCNVVFAELDFTPGVMEQCMDRAHRIGQDNPVNVYYLVLEGSLDAYLVDMLKDKADVFKSVMR